MNLHTIAARSLIILILYSLSSVARSEFSVSRGTAQSKDVMSNNIFPHCKDGKRNPRPSPVGKIKSLDGKSWTVPITQRHTKPIASDLYNPCIKAKKHKSIKEIDLKTVPITNVDEKGEVYTAYIFADNYFELFINGTIVGVDPIPFTPFNSSLVRFRAKKPFSIAIKLIDWEENLGQGTEANRGSQFHPGDGGLIASFRDQNDKIIAVTDSSWKARAVYISPVKGSEKELKKALGTTRESQNLKIEKSCNNSCLAIHYTIPNNWSAKEFDDKHWPSASTYTEETIGVKNKKSFMNFTEIFRAGGAKFIWSKNLVLDNQILVRKLVQ